MNQTMKGIWVKNKIFNKKTEYHKVCIRTSFFKKKKQNMHIIRAGAGQGDA